MTDEKIICALLSNPSIADASKSLNITPQTIYNKLRDDAFKEKYASARRDVLEQNCYILQSYLSDAIEEIHSIAINKDIASQIRLNACDLLIRHCYRMTELTDIMSRLENMEALVLTEAV